MDNKPVDIPNIRIITISGKIGSGSTTLAHKLSKTLGWRHIEGGEVFWEAVRNKLGLGSKDTNLRPDEEDVLFDQKLKKMLQEEKNIILETKLAAFNAQGIEGVYKILMVCENSRGEDQTQVRIDRLINRDGLIVEKAKEEIIIREKNDLEKWIKLYADGDPSWTYWDRKYYDLTINTFDHNKEEVLEIVLQKMKKLIH